jgi:hypothetical protein
MGATLGRIVSDYHGLVEVCRQRADELEISRCGIDSISGLAAGQAGKILGRKQKMRMGPVSLGLMLETLGLKMLIIEDEAATARTRSLRIPVDRANQRFDNNCNSQKQLPKVAPKRTEPVLISTASSEDAKLNPSRAHLRVVQGKRRGSKYG